ARTKGLQLHVLKASSESEIDTAFASLVQLHAGALVVAGDPFLSSRREQLAALASRHAVPSIEARRKFAASGGLISYGASLTSAFRLVGPYTGKVLKAPSPPICRSSSRRRQAAAFQAACKARRAPKRHRATLATPCGI